MQRNQQRCHSKEKCAIFDLLRRACCFLMELPLLVHSHFLIIRQNNSIDTHLTTSFTLLCVPSSSHCGGDWVKCYLLVLPFISHRPVTCIAVLASIAISAALAYSHAALSHGRVSTHYLRCYVPSLPSPSSGPTPSPPSSPPSPLPKHQFPNCCSFYCSGCDHCKRLWFLLHIFFLSFQPHTVQILGSPLGKISNLW